MKDDPVRGALDKKNAALLAAAYLAENITNSHLNPSEVNAQSMAYIYNPDVHSFGNPKQYIGCDILELQVQKRIHPDLKDENFPSPEVLRHSKHIHHVLDNLKRIDEVQKQSNEHKH